MKLIGLIGKMYSGKDTVFEFLQKLVPDALRLAFGDLLKVELAGACGVSVEYINANKDQFRYGLQWWGTEFRRELFGEDYWVDQVEAKLARLAVAMPTALVVVTDVRFPNEAEMVRRRGGTLWKIDRDHPQDDLPHHDSEILVDAIRPDVVIRNRGTLEQLDAAVKDLYPQFEQMKQNLTAI